ncbi:MAG: chromate efflux transporter [Methylomonas sp.]|nr:chromate efflux transporter [Methylomonas sp.]PPD21666.1 MAG: chromate transporter [Methylomonas sp.]PPD25953.1 MAG: chromate transporter [Methylomonas sp.]PPD37689.1 MAG: chromate transporter [Methylomonas sp.]PPD39296.1 MAG: chromate transporter [Methylomonas sp.]
MTTNTPQPPAAPSLAEASRFWLKLGFISFGGPAGQIAILHQELVERRRWISENRYLHALNYCMILPGPEAQQLATYIGWLLHKTPGALIAGGLFVLPSLLILIGLGWVYMRFGDLPAVAGLLYGIKPAVTAIVLFAAYRIGRRVLKNRWLWAMAAVAFIAIFALHLPFPLIVITAGLLGAAGGRWMPDRFAVGGGHGKAMANSGPAVIDDDTPPPAHAVFSRQRFYRLLGIGFGLWAVVLGGLCAGYGWQNGLTQMAWFFTKAAWLTFGGAYAVLPYVYEAAVEHYRWLTPQQMMDALALGETTPGPLVMINAFVGFVAGWGQAGLVTDSPFWAGVLAAVVVTYFTFLPSFLFILAGGPLVETTHGNVSFTAPLTAVTAAVVGVIVNLAVFFAYHVFWPHGWGGGFDGFSALLSLLALLALLRFKTGIIPVIAASAVAGGLWSFL